VKYHKGNLNIIQVNLNGNFGCDYEMHGDDEIENSIISIELKESVPDMFKIVETNTTPLYNMNQLFNAIEYSRTNERNLKHMQIFNLKRKLHALNDKEINKPQKIKSRQNPNFSKHSKFLVDYINNYIIPEKQESFKEFLLNKFEFNTLNESLV